MAGSERAAVGTTRTDSAETATKPNFDFIEATLGKILGDNNDSTSKSGEPSSPAIKNAFDASTKEAVETIAKHGGSKAVREKIEEGSKTLGDAVKQFQNGERSLPGKDSPARRAEEERIRKTISSMTPEVLAKAFKGNGSPANLEALNKVFNSAEKEVAKYNSQMEGRLNQVARETLKHAAEASKTGYANDDRTAKATATRALRNLKADDPISFTDSPYAAELKGALTQAQRKEVIDLSKGKAAAVGYSQEARDLRAKETPGSSDKYEIINNLAMAQLANAEQAQVERQKMEQNSSRGWQNMAADGGGLASTLLTAHAVNLAQTNLAKVLPVVAKVDARIATGVTIGTALLAGGVANNYLRDESLTALSGFGRNTFVSGITVAAMKGLNVLPEAGAASKFADAGRIAGTLGVGAAYGSAYKGMSIVAGDRIEGANYRDPAQWGSEMAWAAGKGAAATLLLSQAIKSGGLIAESALPNNVVGNVLKQAGAKEVASGAIASTTFMVSPLHDRMVSSYEQSLYGLRADQARKMLESQNKIASKMASQISLERR